MEEYRERVMMESAYEWVKREGEMAKQEYDRTLNALTNELKGYMGKTYQEDMLEMVAKMAKEGYSVIDNIKGIRDLYKILCLFIKSSSEKLVNFV